MLVLTRRLYLNSDKTKVVEHNDPDAAFLIGPAGAVISEKDAKRLGVSHTEVYDGETAALAKMPVAFVPSDPDDDKLYHDQSEEGKAARKAARDTQTSGLYQYVRSTGGSEEDAERAVKEASGEAATKGPSSEDMQVKRDALVGKGKAK